MNKARELIEGGQNGDFIVIADFQTSGRGRIQGRTWEGAPGSSLLMTVAIRESGAIAAAPLRVGLGVLDAIRTASQSTRSRQYPESLAIKWPNDILGIVNGEARKLGGILCESAQGTLLAGIGINLGKNAYPREKADEATSLEELEAWDTLPSSTEKIEGLAVKIANTIGIRLRSETWLPEYSNYLWGVGKEVCFLLGHPSLGNCMSAIMKGVDMEGRILLRDESGFTHAYNSGEISRIRSL